jgi:hypothetical protein
MKFRSLFALVALTLLSAPSGLEAQVTFIPRGSTWRYLDNGSDQGTAWRAAGFNDSGWAQGPAPLGYGDGDESTVVSYGPSATAKYITTYFRKAFTVSDPSQVAGLKLGVLRDDGAVIYLNGVEIARSNMPAGTIAYNTLSPVAVSGADETTTFYPFSVSPSLLAAGTNVMGVEIHQQAGTSSDISFDLVLTDDAATLERSPYLQSVSPSAATLRWRTSAADESVVHYGLTAGDLNTTVSSGTPVTEHAVTLTGLTPNTRYYYSVGSAATVWAQSAEHYFETHPVTGTARNTRLWVLGDSGTANANAVAVRNAFYAWNGSQHADLLLMLGDNAYNSGTDAEYTTAVFNMYPDTLRNTPLWPTIGNHDSASSDSPTQSGPYFTAFDLPANGSSGGVASGTEAYYAFDYANLHIVCLDSDDTNRSTSGAMYQWLQSDLAATSQEWIIAFFHHPPYTKGTHDSDAPGNLTDMRVNFLPLLESYGVDLVLCGHSHVYERSFLLDGHYGTSNTFDAATMVKDGSSGNPATTGPYAKQPIPRDGAVYVVAGSSGQAGTGPLNHPAMYLSMSELGSLVLDVNGNVLNAKFLTGAGAVADQFAIRHEEPPAPPSGVTATGEEARVVLDWADNTEPDLAGYRVLRSTTAGSGFVQVAQVTASNWTDLGVTNGTTYYYVITAFDSAGIESGLSAQVSATPVAAPVEMWVQNIGMSLISKRNWVKATAGVTVRKTGGTAVTGATVSGQWTLDGAPAGTASGNTNNKGVVSLSSPQLTASSGSEITFTVTSVTAAGQVYNSGLNIETSDSITVP